VSRREAGVNRLVKVSIAGAAGLALLLGGAGTLALWNTAPAAFNGSAVQSGVLRVDFPSTASAKYTGTNTPATHIVPGDAVTVDQPIRVTATGDSLRVTLAFTVDLSAADTAVEHALDQGFTFKAFNAAGAEVGYTNISAADAALITSVEGSFVLPASTGNDLQNSSLSIGRANVTVTQVP
jgi:alternate signal-mediated exported protein